MTKKVLDVGNCNPDHSSLTRLLKQNFEVDVLRAHGMRDTLDLLKSGDVDLVLVNRVMDRDGASGLEIIQKMKSNPELAAVPVMMITNYEDAQQSAIEAGAEPGFGKSALTLQSTLDKLEPFLEE
ncbi:response regulator [Thalassoglobus polymorphus]|uniref:Response regulator PleD n=1 Tax=Thalassoglobus polymorphus TaxID=2527994 RepID=A0A517QLR3_9PLAN|nr:response regulator [Thalassoglobus polymorphus]QDT32477.1 response regulator PleD [Thalassoglobus polymorphus]